MWQAQPCIVFLLNRCCRSHYIDADPDLACHFYADPDPASHFDSDPDTSLQIKVQTLKMFSNMLICHTFWLVIYKLLRIRIRILPFNLMRIRNTGYMYGIGTLCLYSCSIQICIHLNSYSRRPEDPKDEEEPKFLVFL